MNDQTPGKVTAAHLARDAYLYVRQSTLHQVAVNTESGRRQYDLRGRAVALGWPTDRVVVIDVDQGHSGASAADRAGFHRLVTEVSLGRAGIVLGLECSRLARNNADWHRLLELCGLNSTLICDEDGLYDPCSFNDRLLLGLKGAMSEAELFVLRARLRGGILSKARRGELTLTLPVGLSYDPAGTVVLDPDAAVRQAFGLLFSTFAATGSARAVVTAFRDDHLTFPNHHHGGPHGGELYWAPLTHSRVLTVLHNPRYAGAYCYGRQRHYTDTDGHHHTIARAREEWTVLIPGAHPGYITWEHYEANLATLAVNAAAHGEDRTAGPAREGPAMLQGLLICGRCGRRMTVRYHTRTDGTVVPDYVCQATHVAAGAPTCQHLHGAAVDAAVATLVLDTLTPLAIEVALTVDAELAARADAADRLRATHITRAEHAAGLARRRYLTVDPANRLVADALEADWNTKLRELAAARDDYDRAKAHAHAVRGEADRQRIRALAADLPALWNDPATPQRERKRLLRLLVADVTLIRDDQTITTHVRLRGGQTHTLTVPIPPNAWQQRKAPPEVRAVIDELLATHTYGQAAAALTARGLTTGDGKPFTATRLRAHCHRYQVPSLWQRLRAAGMLTLDEAAAELDAHPHSVKRWYRLGLVTGRITDDRGTCLYHPSQTRPTPTLVETTGKALGDTHRSGRSHHPAAALRPETVAATRHDG
ncbi:recombinase family protein, partial [Frankia sp. CiP3]|uniref:recombinase family protein n=1 Tax=Frankia sp. CiP3 TaxID=2880971 RepID=UPI00272E0C7E